MVTLSSLHCLETTLVGVKSGESFGPLKVRVGSDNSPPRNHAIVCKALQDGALNLLLVLEALIEYLVISSDPNGSDCNTFEEKPKSLHRTKLTREFVNKIDCTKSSLDHLV